MTLQVIVGGQFGSEGKGAVAAYLAARSPDILAVRVAGPNAGHTVIGRCPPGCPDVAGVPAEVVQRGAHKRDAHPWRLRHVPVAAVANPESYLAIAPGSEIDPDVLTEEVLTLELAGYKVKDRLWVDPSATLIDPIHHDIEAGTGSFHQILDPNGSLVERIGSTGKGVGAARGSRIMREARLVGEYDWADDLFTPADVGEFVRSRLYHDGDVQIEGTQGYGLGQHAGFYPQCTSSDCTAMDFLAMAGCPPWLAGDDLQVWVVFRTHPIRVAGNSGPLANEVTWAEVGQPEELTTVTRRVRRVGRWDGLLARKAMEANGYRPSRWRTVRAALTMADYVVPSIAGATSLTDLEPHQLDLIDQLVAARSKDLGALIGLIGTGPATMINYQGVRP